MEIKIKPDQIKFLGPNELKPNPKNRNKHSKEQIDRLCDLIKYQGFRQPIIVSNRSGMVVAGHGRLQAAKQLALAKVPVAFQDFDSDEQEWAYGISDNAIGSWSELDMAGINIDLPEFGPFDLDLLGLENFSIDPKFSVEKEIEPPPEEQFIVTVMCTNETEMQSVYEEMRERGFNCKLIT